MTDSEIASFAERFSELFSNPDKLDKNLMDEFERMNQKLSDLKVRDPETHAKIIEEMERVDWMHHDPFKDQKTTPFDDMDINEKTIERLPGSYIVDFMVSKKKSEKNSAWGSLFSGAASLLSRVQNLGVKALGVAAGGLSTVLDSYVTMYGWEFELGYRELMNRRDEAMIRGDQRQVEIIDSQIREAFEE